jgi:hypothetical protein
MLILSLLFIGVSYTSNGIIEEYKTLDTKKVCIESKAYLMSPQGHLTPILFYNVRYNYERNPYSVITHEYCDVEE